MTDIQKKHEELREKLMNILYEVNGAPLGYYVDKILQTIVDSLPEEVDTDEEDYPKYCACDGECFGGYQYSSDLGYNGALSEVKQILTGEKQ